MGAESTGDQGKAAIRTTEAAVITEGVISYTTCMLFLGSVVNPTGARG